MSENESRIITSLQNLRTAVKKNSIQQLSDTKKFDLSFASWYAPKIKSMSNQVHGAKKIIEDIVFFLVAELSTYLTSRSNISEEIEDLSNRIIRQYGDRLTISSIAHWVYLVQSSKPPFDKDLKGFDRRGLMVLIGRYVSEQKEWKLKMENQEDREKEMKLYQIRISKMMESNSKARSKIESIAEEKRIKKPNAKELKDLSNLKAKEVLRNE